MIVCNSRFTLRTLFSLSKIRVAFRNIGLFCFAMIFALSCDKNDTSVSSASIDSNNYRTLAVERLVKVLQKPGVIHDMNMMKLWVFHQTTPLLCQMG